MKSDLMILSILIFWFAGGLIYMLLSYLNMDYVRSLIIAFPFMVSGLTVLFYSLTAGNTKYTESLEEKYTSNYRASDRLSVLTLWLACGLIYIVLAYLTFNHIFSLVVAFSFTTIGFIILLYITSSSNKHVESRKVLYCQYCGYEITDELKYCPVCLNEIKIELESTEQSSYTSFINK